VSGGMPVWATTLLVASACARSNTPPPADVATLVPPQRDTGGFVSRTQCQACHPSQHASHARTYHRTMTQAAVPGAVLSPFAGERLEDRGQAFVVRQDQGAFFVDEVIAQHAPEDGALVIPPAENGNHQVLRTRRVALTTGSHHTQAYWFRNDAGVLQQFLWVWLVESRRWIPNADSFLVDPAWADRGTSGRWDDSCFRCHATGWSREDASRQDHVSVGDLGISCGACHGPAQQHVEVNHNPVRRWMLAWRDAGDETVVQPQRLESQRAQAVCAQCHSESLLRVEPGGRADKDPFRAGERHEDRFLPRAAMNLNRVTSQQNITRPRVAGAFWPDGTARVAGREHSAMMLSGCFTKGTMTCVSCHSMHNAPADRQVSSEKQGNAMCTQCHATLPEHSHHNATSSGAQCINCHMPRVTYGLLAARANHRFDSPTASGVGSRDKPNACNLCHLDQTLAWTAKHLGAWYGQPTPQLPEDHQTTAAGVVWATTGDAAQRAIVAWHLGWDVARAVSGESWQTPVLSALLEDRYAAVRFMAGVALFGDGGKTTHYDFVASASARRDVATKALAQWRAQRSGRVAQPAVLVQQDGDVDQQRLEVLMHKRDDSPVGITE
jgi:predicted CXXCH cytochrome family protein